MIYMPWSVTEYRLKKKKRSKNKISQSDKLIQRLNSELNLQIPIGTKINQLKPSLSQLSRGSFKWVFEGAFSGYGSTLSIQELLRSEQLEITYTSSGGLSTHPSSLRDIQPAS